MGRGFGLALLAVLVLAACGTSTPSGCLAPVPIGEPAQPAIPVPQVLYPNASFTGATNGGFNIVLAFQYGTALRLASAAGNVATQNVVVPAPTPLPGGATPEPNETPAAYFVPASSLASGTTYTIVGVLTGSCGFVQTTTLGTFSTLPAP